MKQEDYRNELLHVMRQHSKKAEQSIKAVLSVLPEKAKAIEFGVFPDQDEEGTFSIILGLDGPDLYVLNKLIDEHRTLFSVRHTEQGLSPAVPLMDPFDTSFCVNDTIVDSALLWIEEIWAQSGGLTSPIPALVFGGDGYGTMTPKNL